MSSWLIYFWFVYDRLYYFMLLIILITIVSYVVFRIVKFTTALANSDKTDVNTIRISYKKFARSIWIMAIVLSSLQLVPNRNQLLLIWGIPKLTHNETVINLSEKSWRYLDNYLDREIKKLRAELSKHNMNKK